MDALPLPRNPSAVPPLSGGYGHPPLGALVDVVFAVDSFKSRRALARVAVDVVRAGPSVLTGFAQTLVNVCLALVPGEARKAQAGERIHSIDTGASILARI